MNQPAADATGKVKGPWMRRLDLYVAAGAPAAIQAMLSTWRDAGRGFNEAGGLLDKDATHVEDGFSATSLSGRAAKSDMRQSGVELQKKYQVVTDAEIALGKVQFQVTEAINDHAAESAKLPGSHEPVNRSDYKTEVIPGEVNQRQADEGKAALDKALSEHAARERAIAHAEQVAAARIRDYDNAVDEAEPKVRALYDDGSGQSNAPSNPAAVPATVPGSASAIAAAQARMAKYNPGVSYAEGDGYELIQREKELIAAEEAKNQPEWNGTEWVNADGTSAPATSYATIETADGLAPLSGGGGGATALAVGLGGAVLAGGIAKAVASKFATSSSAAGKAQAAKAAGATSRTAAGARSTTANGRSLSGAGARTAGGTAAGSRSAGRGGPGGAGSRAGGRGAGSAGGRGAGTAGNRGTRGKNDERNGQEQDWQADYTDDWTDPDYRVWDPKTDSGRSAGRTGESVDKKSDD